MKQVGFRNFMNVHLAVWIKNALWFSEKGSIVLSWDWLKQTAELRTSRPFKWDQGVLGMSFCESKLTKLQGEKKLASLWIHSSFFLGSYLCFPHIKFSTQSQQHLCFCCVFPTSY